MRRLRESYELKILPLTWSAFHESFIKRYKPFDHTRGNRNQLIQLRQGNDFNTYVDNFQQLLKQVDHREFSPQEKLHYFTEGLHPDTRFQVVSKQCPTVENAILVAAEVDSCRSKQEYPTQFAQNRPKTHNNRPNNPTHQA
jgi:hypothetical protein